MSFFGDLFSSLKYNIFKKSFYFILLIVSSAGTYFIANKSGKDSARYDCLANERQESNEIGKEMNLYKSRLNYEYSKSISEIHDKCNNDNVSDVDCRVFQ